jgi:hypothetical protein
VFSLASPPSPSHLASAVAGTSMGGAPREFSRFKGREYHVLEFQLLFLTAYCSAGTLPSR